MLVCSNDNCYSYDYQLTLSNLFTCLQPRHRGCEKSTLCTFYMSQPTKPSQQDAVENESTELTNIQNAV